jgi:hypothetical protein
MRWMLALLLLGQIGGYFTVSGVPDWVYEGYSFTVTVQLETSAKQDFTLNVSGDNLEVEPAKVIIRKGTKKGTFKVTARLLPGDEIRYRQRLPGRLIISSGKKEEVREVTILPLADRRR